MIPEGVGFCEGMLLIPSSSLGHAYRTVSYRDRLPNPEQFVDFLGITSTADNTKVMLRLAPNKNAVVEYMGVTYSSEGNNQLIITLAKHETFALMSDITGSLLLTYVLSNNPIAVFVGGVRSNSNQVDMLLKQLIPIGRQGNSYVIPDFFITDWLTAVSNKPGTLLKTSSYVEMEDIGYLEAGETVQITHDGSSNVPQTISSEEDFGLTIYTHTGRPSIDLLSVQNWKNEYSIIIPDMSATTYIIITPPIDYKHSVMILDGNEVPLTTNLDVDPGYYNLQLKDGPRFGAFLYVQRPGNSLHYAMYLPSCLTKTIEQVCNTIQSGLQKEK